MLAGRVQGHRGLGVVPRVEMVPPEPRNGPVLPLLREDSADGDGGLLGGEDPGQDEVFCPGRRHLVSALASVFASTREVRLGRVRHEALAYQRVQRLFGDPGREGFFMMSQTSSLWYARTGSALSLSTPNAHFSHQYGECSAWA